MRALKIILFLFTLLPAICFSNTVDKPHLVLKANSESLILDNGNIKDAHMIKNDDGLYSLAIVLTPLAAEQLTNLTTVNVGKVMSLSYGADKLISQATIQSPLGGSFQISRFPEKEGNDLIASLKNKQSQ